MGASSSVGMLRHAVRMRGAGYADLVVEALDEYERNLVLGSAVSGDAIPMTVDYLGEPLIGCDSLPRQARSPVLENRRAQPSRS